MKDKKSFVLYCDLIHTVKKMPKEKAGELFLTILEYVNDLNPIIEDLTVDLVFEPIKQQLKRDLCKYEDRKKKWSEAGKKSGKARTNKVEPPSTTLNKVKQPSTKRTVNVNDSVNVNVNDINIYRKFKHLSLSKNEFTKLESQYTKSQIDDILDRIENYNKNTNYTSLYLTAISWLKKQYAESVEIKETPEEARKRKYTESQKMG